MYFFSSPNFQDTVCYFLCLAYCRLSELHRIIACFSLVRGNLSAFQNFPWTSVVWIRGSFSSCCWMVQLKRFMCSMWIFSSAWILHINWPMFSLIFYQRFPGTFKQKKKIWWCVCEFCCSLCVMFFCFSKVGQHGPCTNCVSPLQPGQSDDPAAPTPSAGKLTAFVSQEMVPPLHWHKAHFDSNKLGYLASWCNQMRCAFLPILKVSFLLISHVWMDSGGSAPCACWDTPCHHQWVLTNHLVSQGVTKYICSLDCISPSLCGFI